MTPIKSVIQYFSEHWESEGFMTLKGKSPSYMYVGGNYEGKAGFRNSLL